MVALLFIHSSPYEEIDRCLAARGLYQHLQDAGDRKGMAGLLGTCKALDTCQLCVIALLTNCI
jgi:hypothetical protein